MEHIPPSSPCEKLREVRHLMAIAAAIGMCIMKNGGSSIDAVEAAIKVLEDREITNAGYGSNLAMDGLAQWLIKNPISLARLLYEHTNKPLTLRRVPPNLLCAQGATEFAAELGVPILPHEMMISEAARERWLRWRSDLKNAERKARKSGQHPSSYQLRPDIAPEAEIMHSQIRQRHTNNLLQGANSVPQLPSSEQKDEPLCNSIEGTSSNVTSEPSASSGIDIAAWQNNERVSTPETIISTPMIDYIGLPSVAESSRSAFINSTQKVPTISQLEGARTKAAEGNSLEGQSNDMSCSAASVNTFSTPHQRESSTDTVKDDLFNVSPNQRLPTPARNSTDILGIAGPPSSECTRSKPSAMVAHSLQQDRPDHITDTVGAIAIDSWGRIACGASSGGIGMKYRGRVGPAALVGVGAAVVPLDPNDSEQVSVATVTSGTGEHMATTMAAMTCAERLYQSVKKERGGEYAEVTEDEALKSMIENEFMGHASVKNSNSAGAIGILGVKKTHSGILLFYGHNTDSFALASMSSEDDVPKCTMSRSNGDGQIAQGGRAISYKSRKRTKIAPRQRQIG
ncbi:hypothetical protein E8E13_008814 [Curvularia kusanoi]|uniref:N-terminal nucleophile aminohydrolase n=1 Tax=Curvularia kusanoi TaxID=90978 RepID=A0A9P4W5K7_CURKU|nr:hypothetical protein E8E13_008814 [Curvularia kusanoi]